MKLTTQLHLPTICGALPPLLYVHLQGFHYMTLRKRGEGARFASVFAAL